MSGVARSSSPVTRGVVERELVEAKAARRAHELGPLAAERIAAEDVSATAETV